MMLTPLSEGTCGALQESDTDISVRELAIEEVHIPRMNLYFAKVSA
jgi:hypothetical protein